MHMQNTPSDMQLKPEYNNINSEVINFFKEVTLEFELMGIKKNRLCIDPGFGFGKTLRHNIAMIKYIQQFQAESGLPLLAGISRKSMIGDITEKAVDQRVAGSIAAALFALSQGAKILRVHDVAETVDAIKVWQALSN